MLNSNIPPDVIPETQYYGPALLIKDNLLVHKQVVGCHLKDSYIEKFSEEVDVKLFVIATSRSEGITKTLILHFP